MANYYVRSAAAGAGTGADWANAFTTLAAAFSGKAAGDVFFVADDHAETQASALALAAPGSTVNPCYIYCVDRAGSVPPVSADLRTTATISTTGTNSISFSGFAVSVYYYGITFQSGTGAGATTFSIGAGHTTFKNCQFSKLSTGASQQAFNMFGQNTVLDGTTLRFGAAGDRIRAGGKTTWINTSAALVGAVVPTVLIDGTIAANTVFNMDCVDLSALGSGKTIVTAIASQALVTLKDCKLGASVVVASTPNDRLTQIVVSRSSSTGANYVEQLYAYEGTQVDETAIIRTGGASDGTTGKSRKITTTANAKWAFPFSTTPLAMWGDSTAAQTATLEGIWNAAALPNNDDIWLDLEYLSDAASGMGSFAAGTKADGLAAGTPLAASTQAWDSLVTARANSTAYTVGQTIKLASNPGRVFFCTTAGTTAAAEPAGYASAVDGGTVNDGTAVFRAGVRFKQSLTFTAAQKGVIYAYVKAAKASSTFYVDPLVVLT